MSSGQVTIDLGVYSYRSAPEELPDRRWPGWAWLLRWRRWFAVMVLAALAVPLAGAATAPAPRLVPLWTVPGVPDGFVDAVVDGERLYAVTGTADRPTLTAYRLADGAVQSETPLGLPDGENPEVFPSAAGIRVADGVALVSTFSATDITTAYDSDTGQLLWSGEGFPHAVQDGFVTMRSWSAAHDPDEPERPLLVVRELTSGTVVASFEWVDDAVDFWQAPGGALHLLTVAGDGLLTSYDLAAGRVADTVATPYQQSSTDGLPVTVRVVADTAMVSDWESGEVVAYDAATLEQRWALEGMISPMSCGPVICLAPNVSWNDASGDLHAVDPVTGAVRWSVDCADGGMSDGCDLYAWELESGNRLLIRLDLLDPRLGEPAQRTWLADAATGRPLTEPTVWAMSPEDGSATLLSLGTGVRAEEAEYRREEDIEPYRLWWARSDLGLDRIEVLGAIEADWCTPHDPYLVCYTQDAPAEVWRIGP